MDAAVLWVVLAGFLEPVWIVALKKYNSTKNLVWALPVLFFMVFDPMCLSWATDGGVSVSVAFSVWVSIGTVLAAVVGYLFYDDPMDRRRIFYILVIMIGIVGLQFTAGGS